MFLQVAELPLNVDLIRARALLAQSPGRLEVYLLSFPEQAVRRVHVHLRLADLWAPVNVNALVVVALRLQRRVIDDVCRRSKRPAGSLQLRAHLPRLMASLVPRCSPL